MRFVLYNMRYGTGPRAAGFMRSSQRNLERIADFLKDLQPDLVGLIEVDYGSYRMGRKNQAEVLADCLGHYHTYATKYGKKSIWRHVPVLNRQGNAFLARGRIRNERFHFFDQGMKRLVMELDLDHVVVYLVHLSLGGKARLHQLAALYDLVRTTDRPCVVAGDFNLLWGEYEIDLFLAATGLQNANQAGLPTFPSSQPHRHLDFVLHSEEIEVTGFQVPAVRFSDHLPLVVDFDVRVPEERRWQARQSHCLCPDPPHLPLEEALEAQFSLLKHQP